MEPIALEIIMRDSTRQGMQSVTGNMTVLEKCIQNNTQMLRQLEKALKEMQTQFAGSTKTIADQTENIAMVEALKNEIEELKAKLIELEQVKKKGAGAPIVTPGAPRAAASSFNGLGMSIQQVARELPSLTMGANMFFLAISNNLPILADNLKVARAEVKALNDAGQKSTPVWKQVASSIFSWQTALVVGITLLTVYGKDIWEWTKNLFKSKEAIDSSKIAMDALNQSLESYKKNLASSYAEYGKQVAIVTRLSSEWSKLGNNLSDKKKFIDQNKSSFSQLGIEVNGVKDAENLLVGNTANFIVAMKLRAQALAGQSTLQELYTKQQKLKDEVEVGKKVAAARAKIVTPEDIEDAEDRNKYGTSTTLKSANQIIARIVRPYQIATEKSKKMLVNVSKNEEALKAVDGRIDRMTKVSANSFLSYQKLMDKSSLKESGAGGSKESKGDSLSIDDISSAELKARQKIEEMKASIMAEGAAKEKAEARARFDAELARIDQEEKERLDALKKAKKNGLPVSKEQVTAVTDQSGQQRKLASQVYVKEFFDVEKEYADKQKKDFDKLLEKYQDYTAQRVDIEKKYSADIAKLQAERDAAQQKGDTGRVDEMNRAIAQATTNKGKDLMGLDYEQLKQTPDYVRAFENLRETSSDTLDSLLSQLESAKQTAAEVLSPDQLREYTTTIQEIMDELDSRNPFGALADRKKELAEAEAELATAQQQLNAVQGGAQIVTGVKNTKFDDKTGKIESEKTYLTTTRAMENYNKAQDNVTKKGAKVKKAEKEVKDVMDDLFNSIKDVGDAVGGPAGEIISLIGDIGLFTMTAMSGIQTVSKKATTAIEQVEKASAILTIIGAAIQIAMKIASLFKGESDEDKKKREIEHYNQIIAIYDKIIDKQKESIKFGFGFSSIEAAKKAMQELTKQTDQYRNIANRDSKEITAAKKDLAQIEEYVNLMKKMGIDVKVKDIVSFDMLDKEWKSYFSEVDTNQLSELSSKQLEYIRDNYKDLWASLTDEQRNALQAIIDAEEKGKEIIDEWKESITGVSYDSFYSEYIDMLSDMDMSAADMAENFGEHLRKSILAAMVAKNFQKDINNLYEMWADAAGENSDSGMDITKDESNAIQQKYKEMVEAMTTARDSMSKDFGWESSATSQSGKAGTFTTMSQDQGTKLEGLFTSVQGHVSNIDDTVKDIVMAMYEAFDVLLRIEANTAYCRHLEQMAADIAELKRDGFKMK